jgi:hypothetical protein
MVDGIKFLIVKFLLASITMPKLLSLTVTLF